MNYKYKLTADISCVNPVLRARLDTLGVSLEQVINEAVAEFYREATKTVVRVDMDSLARIRKEALQTQEKLIVEEEMPVVLQRNAEMHERSGTAESAKEAQERKDVDKVVEEIRQGTCAGRVVEEIRQGMCVEKIVDASWQGFGELSARETGTNTTSTASGPWDGLWKDLTDVEREALHLLVSGEGGLKQFADSRGMMLEVLMDGINEKAMDHVGDGLFDEEFVLYEDYVEEVRRMVER